MTTKTSKAVFKKPLQYGDALLARILALPDKDSIPKDPKKSISKQPKDSSNSKSSKSSNPKQDHAKDKSDETLDVETLDLEHQKIQNEAEIAQQTSAKQALERLERRKKRIGYNPHEVIPTDDKSSQPAIDRYYWGNTPTQILHWTKLSDEQKDFVRVTYPRWF
jgi:hypothetical protein